MAGDSITTILLIGAIALWPLIGAVFHSRGYAAAMADAIEWIEGEEQ